MYQKMNLLGMLNPTSDGQFTHQKRHSKRWQKHKAFRTYGYQLIVMPGLKICFSMKEIQIPRISMRACYLGLVFPILNIHIYVRSWVAQPGLLKFSIAMHQTQETQRSEIENQRLMIGNQLHTSTPTSYINSKQKRLKALKKKITCVIDIYTDPTRCSMKK